MAIQHYHHVSADAGIRSGQPVIEGTSVPVSLVVSAVAIGKSLREVAQQYDVSLEDVRAALEYAVQRTSEPVAGVVDLNRAGDNADSAAGPSKAAEDEAARLGLDAASLSPLGKRLLELRAEGIAAGEPEIATWEALDAEIAERRGGVYPESDI